MIKQKISVQMNIPSFAHGTPGMSDRRSYMEALKAELASAADYEEDYAIEALCITGSNPLQYPVDMLVEIIETLKRNIEFQPNAEITLNALPGSVTYGDIKTLHDHGLNRISFDMHTFVPAELDALGRTYAPRALEVFMRMVQLKMTFFNYDITLYYGLPGQTLETFHFSIIQAIRFMGMHITLLPYDNVEKSKRMAFYREGVRIIEETAFKQYSPIHFSRTGYDSQWDKLTYSNLARLGFGVGSVSVIDNMVSRNTADVQTYIEAAGDPSKIIVEMQPITQNRIDSNTLLDRLYHLEACRLSSLATDVKKRAAVLVEQGLLIEGDNGITLSEEGKMDWNTVVNEFEL